MKDFFLRITKKLIIKYFKKLFDHTVELSFNSDSVIFIVSNKYEIYIFRIIEKLLFFLR